MGNNPLVQPDPGLYIWTIVTFLVLLALLTRYAWKPLLAALLARQEGISQSLDGAKRANEDMERMKRESAEIIRRAHVEASAIVSASRTDAERVREETKQKARGEAAAILAAAERQIQAETVRARDDVRREAVDLSVAIASKLIRRNITVEDNKAMIDEMIGSLPSN
jgi:F-type H+-transporting ATPase subunit b